MKKIKKWSFKTFWQGFAMGSVDIIPGISGGTMALILGVYEKIIQELKKINLKSALAVLTSPKKQKIKPEEKINLAFLIPLFLGIITAIISLAKIISYCLEKFPQQTYSLFFGLILSSIFIILPKKFYQQKNSLFLIPGLIFAWIISSNLNISSSDSYFNIFLSGAIAICAMILPGISGSFVLMILGKYEFMLGAIKSPLLYPNFIYVIVFSLGCLVGLLSFVRLLNFLLKKYYRSTMATLIGFMIGALKIIWPFKAYGGHDLLFGANILLIVAGIFIGIKIAQLGKKNKE